MQSTQPGRMGSAGARGETRSVSAADEEVTCWADKEVLCAADMEVIRAPLVLGGIHMGGRPLWRGIQKWIPLKGPGRPEDSRHRRHLLASSS
eukprot:1724856-Pyramimonas_sp.AAC.1